MSRAKTTSSIESSDGICLNQYFWKSGKANTVICIAHGLGEHMNRYGRMADFFNNQGIDVEGIDMRGHGKSQGKRGHTPSFDQLLIDYDLSIKSILDKYDSVFLFGHSMGGNVLVNYLISDYFKSLSSENIKGAIISSPWLETPVEVSGIELALAKLLSNIVPSFTQGNRLKLEDLSNLQETIDDYANDPLNHDQISIKLFIEGYNVGIEAVSRGKEVNIPCLIYHGDSDNITSAPASKTFSDWVPDSTYKLWKNTKHEPHNDLVENEVYNLILEWIQPSI